MRNRLAFLILLSTTFITSSWADDSVDAALAGGIVLSKSPEIAMQDETLTITKFPSKDINQGKFGIDVDFHFKNTSKQDLVRKIAFVLPPVDCHIDTVTMWRGLENTDSEMNNNGLKDFTVTVNDQTQHYTVRREAMMGNRNITDLLTTLKIPLNPCQIKIETDNYPDKKYRNALQQNHLLDSTNSPAWSEHIYFEWLQKFPSNKIVHIQHHYTPVNGQSVTVPYTISDLTQRYSSQSSAQHLMWLRDPSTLTTTNPMIVNHNSDDHQIRFCLSPMWLDYQLTTGANWQKGIGLFKLIIKDENGATFAVNKFYKDTDQVQKTIQDNTMIFIARNFIPQKNLFVMFLALPQTRQDLQICGM